MGKPCQTVETAACGDADLLPCDSLPRAMRLGCRIFGFPACIHEMRALLQPGEGVGARQALAALDTLAAKQGAEAPELPDKPLRTLEESLKQKLAEFREAPEDPPVVEEKRHVPIYVKFSSGLPASSSSPLPRRPMAKARLEPPSTEAAVQPESFALPSSAIAAPESEPAEASESFALAPAAIAAPEPEPAVEPEALQNFMRNVGKVLLNLGEYELLECEFAHQEGDGVPESTVTHHLVQGADSEKEQDGCAGQRAL